MPSEPLLAVEDLSVRFPTKYGQVEAVSDVTLEVHPGETVAVVGESGSGKSVTALASMGLLETATLAGSIRYRGEELTNAARSRMRQLRGNDIAMVFQNPMTSLDPLYTVGEQIGETLRFHRKISRGKSRRRAIELLEEVGIPDPDRRVRAYPHELSGGQRQRVVIAMALACSPSLLIADEPTTALDVTVEAQILRLMRRLQQEHGTALLFITHDVGVVARMADRVVVMYAGQVVEQGPVRDVLLHPNNPYTSALLHSIPRPDIARDQPMPAIGGAVPNLFEVPEGCRFNPRCPVAVDQCRTKPPPMYELPGGIESRCWLHDSALASSEESPGEAVSRKLEAGYAN